MMLTICILILGVQIALLFGGYLVYRAACRSRDRLESDLRSFFEASPDGGASDFAKSVDAMADIFAGRIGVTIQGSIRGILGSQAREISRGLEQTAIEQAPELGIMGMLPKSLKKNPLALAGLQGLLSRILQGGQGAHTGAVKNSEPAAKFNL